MASTTTSFCFPFPSFERDYINRRVTSLGTSMDNRILLDLVTGGFHGMSLRRIHVDNNSASHDPIPPGRSRTQAAPVSPGCWTNQIKPPLVKAQQKGGDKEAFEINKPDLIYECLRKMKNNITIMTLKINISREAEKSADIHTTTQIPCP